MVEYHDIVLTAGKQKKRGSLSWSSASASPPPSSMEFRSRTSTNPVTIRLADIKTLSWSRHFDGFTLRVGLAGGTVIKFSGFSEDAYRELLLLAQLRSVDISKETVSTKGTNAGQLGMTDSALMFVVDGATAFELPLHLIAQAVAQSRNEVALELHHDDDNPAQQLESLVEMRIHIPEDAKPRGEDEDEVLSDEEEVETPAQLFARELQLRGDLGSGSAQPLAQFEKLLFSVPRGKYDVELFPTFLKLASQTYTYKIAYKNVNKMFLFDLQDSAQHLFVIGLNPPVRQGRTAYPYLVVQFDSSEYLEQKFPAIDEATAEAKYGGLLKPSMKGPSHDVVTRVFKALMKKKVLIPGHSFVASHGGSSIQCSYKANEGHLFFLEKSFFFLKKPPMHIRHASITSVEFDRMSSANKRFGMKVSVNDQKATDLVFTNIARDEFDRVFTFMQEKGIHVITNGEEAQADGAAAGGSRRRAGAAAADDADDPYLNRIRADAEDEADDGEAKRGGEESDSDNDEDFTVSSAEDDDDGSASEEDEELESEVDEDMGDSKAGKAKAKPAAKGKGKGKAKRGKSKDDSGSAASDNDGDDERPAKKKKALSGYNLFSRERRPVLQKDNPSATFGELTTLVAAEWKKESEAMKAEYAQRAAAINRGDAAAAQPERGTKRKRPEPSDRQVKDEEMKEADGEHKESDDVMEQQPLKHEDEDEKEG